MTIEYIPGDGNGGEFVKMTACPYCDEEIGKHENFVQHWKRCPANPETEADE